MIFNKLNQKTFLIFILLITWFNISSAQFLKEHGQLMVSNTSLLDQNGDPLVLRGMSYGWHNWWPRFYNKGTVKWLKEDWNCTVLRAAMGIDVEDGYLEKPEWSQNKIEKVVKAAIENDIYVIIDWHSHNIHLEPAKKFFQEMAKKYGEYPHVIYEIFNEPDDESWHEVKKYSEELITTIRAIDPDNLILIGSPHWNQDIHIVADDPIKGFDNIMYTLHFYAAGHGKKLRKRANYALKKGIPLFVSESAGMEPTGDGRIDLKEWNRWIDWMEKNKISGLTWSIADKDETCSVLYPEASSTGSWKIENLKKSGKLIRAKLRNYSY